jgi:hypothetical protein
MIRDLGDFQTPPELVDQVLAVLGPVGRLWPRVLEPTCGTGNFVAGLLRGDSPPQEIRGFEIQDQHLRKASQVIGSASGVTVDLRTADIFQTDFRKDLSWNHSGPLLVLGNPPWVTNSELGCLSSANTPKKTNLHKLSGIAAITGESNFDLGEALWIKLLTELEHENPTIALLCKTVVARSVLRFAAERCISIARAEIRGIDARKWFSAAVDACLFVVQMGPGQERPSAGKAFLCQKVSPAPPSNNSMRASPSRGSNQNWYKAVVYADLSSSRPKGIVDGSTLCRTAAPQVNAESAGQNGFTLTWRQGIKHDAVSVMELTEEGPGRWRNKLGAVVEVEPAFVYPLLKSSDLFNSDRPRPRRSLIVTQKRIGENTDRFRVIAPMLWNYLQKNRGVFAKRKSSVFKGRPDFSLFGVGEYSFADYKVAIAGMYSEPRFRVVGPIRGKPVMLDDTCYFAPCESQAQAALLANLLNDPACLNLLTSLVFPGGKRPITKTILQRIDFAELVKRSGKKPPKG